MATTTTTAATTHPASPTMPGPSAARCGDTRTGALRIGDAYFNARHDRIEVLLPDGTWARVSTPKEIRAAATAGMSQVRITPPGYDTSLTMDVPVSSMHGKGGPVQVTSTDPGPLVAAVWHGLATGKGSATVTIPNVHGAALTLGHARNEPDRSHLVSVEFPGGRVVTARDRDPAAGEYVASFLSRIGDPAGWDAFAEHPVGQVVVAQLVGGPSSALQTAAANPDTWVHLARRRDLDDAVVITALNAGADPGLFVAAASSALRRRIVDSVELSLLFDDPAAVAVVTGAFLAAVDDAEGTSHLARLSAEQLRRFALAHPGVLSTAQVDRFFGALGADVALSLDNVDRRAIDMWVTNSVDGDELTAVLANPTLSPEQRRDAYRRLAAVVGPEEAARRDREALDRRLRDPQVSALLSDTTPAAVRAAVATAPEKAVLYGNREALAALSDTELVALADASGLGGMLVQSLPVARRVALADPDRIEHWAANLGAAGVTAVVDAVFADPAVPADRAAAVLQAALATHSRIDEPPQEILNAAMRSPHPQVHDVVIDAAMAWVRTGIETRTIDGFNLLGALAANRDLSPEHLARIAAMPGFTGHATLVAGDPARVQASLTNGVRSPSHLTAVAVTAAYAGDVLDDAAREAVRSGIRQYGQAAAAARPQAGELAALCRLHVEHAAAFAAAHPGYSTGRETFALVQTAMREAVRSGEPGLAWSYANVIRNDAVLAANLPGLLPLFDKAYATELRAVSVHQQAHALAVSSRANYEKVVALEGTLNPFRRRVRRQHAEQLAREVEQVERLVEENPWIFTDPRLAAPAAPLSRAQATELRASASLFSSWRRAAKAALTSPPRTAPVRSSLPAPNRRPAPQRRR